MISDIIRKCVCSWATKWCAVRPPFVLNVAAKITVPRIPDNEIGRKGGYQIEKFSANSSSALWHTVRGTRGFGHILSGSRREVGIDLIVRYNANHSPKNNNNRIGKKRRTNSRYYGHSWFFSKRILSIHTANL